MIFFFNFSFILITFAKQLSSGLRLQVFSYIYFKKKKGRVGQHKAINKISTQLFSQDYGLASRNTYVVCVKFIHEWLDLQFKIDSERQIIEKLFHGRLIYSQSFCQESVERKSPKYIYFYSLMSTPNYRFLRNFFVTGLFTLRVFARNLLRGNRRRNIFF